MDNSLSGISHDGFYLEHQQTTKSKASETIHKLVCFEGQELICRIKLLRKILK